MKTIKKKYLIKAPVEAVWQSLVDPKIIEKWGGGPAEMSEKEGSEFKLWGGDIFGKNTEVIKNKKLAQDWYGGVWDKPSKLVIILTKKGKSTLLELLQKNVPENEAKDIDSGWDDYYLGPMKKYLEKSTN
jgi:activator of HSP90 ATPase